MTETIGQQMRRVRERRGLTVRQAAARVDQKITHSTIFQVERGSDPRLDTVIAMCRAYDVAVKITPLGDVHVTGVGINAIEEA